MKLSLLVASLLLTLAGTSPVFAGGEHAKGDHWHGTQAQYGGVLARANDIDYELVVKADSLTLYVLDHGKKVPAAGIKAHATVYAGSDKIMATLAPAEENKLVGKGSFKSGVGVRVAVNVTLPGKAEEKLNFRLK